MSAATCKIQHYLKTPNTVDSGKNPVSLIDRFLIENGLCSFFRKFL
jgi:hypothetical protein